MLTEPVAASGRDLGCAQRQALTPHESFNCSPCCTETQQKLFCCCFCCDPPLTQVFFFPTDMYLKLEDVTRKFNKPCIMDVKIGQKSYDPYASAEKIQQQVSKYPLMEEIGFLVLGMRVRTCFGFKFSSCSGLLSNTRYSN